MAKKASIKPLTGNHGDFSGIVLKAAARGDVAAVKHYLKVNPQWLNQAGPHGRTLLWEAVYKGRTELVAELIALGADMEVMGSYYTPMLVELSALAVARAGRHRQLAELLEESGAQDDLYAACHRGDLNAINAYLSTDANAVNTPSKDVPPHSRMGYLPIHYAVAGKQLGALRLLVGYGARIGDEMTLLLDWADDDREIVGYLKSLAIKGESHDTQDTATEAHSPETLAIPAIDRPDWMGFPLLVDACRGNHNAPDDPKRVQQLLARGANVNVRDHKGKTPLHRAGQAGFTRITRLLLESGSDLEIEDNDGGTPIFDAAFYGRGPVVAQLISAGANIRHTDKRNETPLFASARGGKPEVFQLLIDAGADAGQRNRRDQTVAELLNSLRSTNVGRKRILEILGHLER